MKIDYQRYVYLSEQQGFSVLDSTTGIWACANIDLHVTKTNIHISVKIFSVVMRFLSCTKYWFKL